MDQAGGLNGTPMVGHMNERGKGVESVSEQKDEVLRGQGAEKTVAVDLDRWRGFEWGKEVTLRGRESRERTERK